MLDERNWETVQDLAEVYTAWGGYAYTQQDHGVNARPQFRRRFGQIVVAAKNQDTREHDIDFLPCLGKSRHRTPTPRPGVQVFLQPPYESHRTTGPR